MSTATFGTNAVDWEDRISFDRLRTERLARLKAQLEASDLGAVLAFDFSNIRYMSATHIGTWAMDKLIRFCLLTRNSDPISWDFGSAAKHHQLYNPWLSTTTAEMDADPHAPHHGRRPPAAGVRGPRGHLDAAGRLPPRRGDRRGGGPQDQARAREVRPRSTSRSASTSSSCPSCSPCSRRASTSSTASRCSSRRARIKTRDEISLLTQAASMVDAAYEELYEFLRPGVRENESVGLVSKTLYDLGSEYVEGVNAISGERCSPHPHVYSDRLIRPGDPAFFDILHSFNGYRTCYYRTFAVGSASPAQRDAYTRAREYMDRAIALVRPGATTADIVKVWPTAQEFGFPDEEAAFALQYGHGVGLSIWEKPIFSRLVSLDHPEVLKEGMFFALETYWPSADGIGRRPHRGGGRRHRRPAARSSRSSRPRSSWSPGSATSPSAARSLSCAAPSPT